MTPLEVEEWVLLASASTNNSSSTSNNSTRQWEATCHLQQWSSCTKDINGVVQTLISVMQHTHHDQVLFYVLSTLSTLIQPMNELNRLELRQWLLSSWASTTKSPMPTFVEAKVAVLLAQFISIDFPHAWPTAMHDVVTANENTNANGMPATASTQNVWLRTWKELFRNIELGHDSVPKEAIRSNQYVINTLIASIQQQQLHNDRTLTLQVLQHYCSWMDKAFIPSVVHVLVSTCLNDPDAIVCLQILYGRGMEPSKKMMLLRDSALFQHIHETVNLTTLDVSPIDTVMEVAKFTTIVGMELLSLWDETDIVPLNELLPLIQQVLDLMVRCLAFDDIDVSGAVIPLVSRLTLCMINHEHDNEPQHDPFRQSLPQLLAILYQQMKYPPDFTFSPDDEDEAEEEIYRTELRKLNQRFVKVAPDVCLQFLCNALANLPLPLSTSSMPDAEVSLRMVFHYCEGIRPPPGLKVVLQNDTFRSILLALHQSDITSHEHYQVVMLYYDLAVRYYPIFQQSPEVLPTVLGAMTGPKGLQHGHPLVRSRSCYLLLKLVKSIVSTDLMRPFVETVVTGIQGLLSSQIRKSLRPDDTLYLFETIGLLLGKTGLSPEEQQQSLAKVMAPHIRSMEDMIRSSELARDPDYFGGALSGSLSAIAYLSKGFTKPCGQVQLVLAETLPTTLVVLESLPGNELIRRTSVILVQRMIQCLGLQVLETVPRFLAIWIVHCTKYGDIVDVAQLCNQLCIKFKQDAGPALDQALLPFLHKCHSLIPMTSDVVVDNVLPPHLVTEQLSIQKLTFTVLQHIVTYRATSVLVSPLNSSSFESILRSMSEGAIHAEGAVMKKTCIQFFHELVDQWGSPATTNGSTITTTPSSSVSLSIHQGFLHYICTTFVPGMLTCILDPAFDETDAMLSRCVVEFSSVLWSFKATQGPEQFHQAIVVPCLQPIGCPLNILAGFQTASTKLEMDVCMKEIVKVLKSLNGKSI